MRKSRLSKDKQERLIEHFVAGTTARCTAEWVGINRKTAAYYFHRLREIIYQATEDETPFGGEIKVDESYFGGQRKGMRGRGAAGKVPVFGLLKRGGRVYAKVIPDAKSKTLMGIIENKIVPDSIVYLLLAIAWSQEQGFNGVVGFHRDLITHSLKFTTLT